jgi:hypothetical protein
MLMRRELPSGGLLAEKFVELTLGRAGLLLVRLRISMRKAHSMWAVTTPPGEGRTNSGHEPARSFSSSWSDSVTEDSIIRHQGEPGSQ